MALSIAVAVAGLASAESADSDLDDPDAEYSESEESEPEESESEVSEIRASWNGSGHLGDKAFDLIIVRPLGVVRIPVGFFFFFPAVFFAEVPPALGGDSKRWGVAVDDVFQLFVMDAIESTFMTPLGQFEEEY